MSDELLTTALRWELDDRVSAEYAHAQRSLTFHCPDPACVAKIVPTKIRNVFFRAPGRHERGCQWEKEISESSALPGTSRPSPSPLLPAVAPTLLGPGPAIRRRLPPTVAELRQLAERLEQAPIVHPGTLPDIVEAWCDMTTDERAAHPLSVADRVRSYATGFLFLPKVGRDISNLNCDQQIVFGAADVKLGSHVFFVTILKKFETEGGSLSISIRIPRNVPSSEGLEQLVGESVTAFWHGLVPSKDRQGRYFSVTAPDETIYDGLVVKRGHLLP